MATNGYCSRPSTQFADGQTRYMLVETDPVQIRVFYYAEDGTPVKVNDTISVEIHNPSWDAESLRYARGSGSFQDASSPTVTLERPSYVRGFEVRYNMVGVTVTSELLGTLMSHALYALIDRYNDDYLSTPCIHNGHAGLGNSYLYVTGRHKDKGIHARAARHYEPCRPVCAILQIPANTFTNCGDSAIFL